MEKDGLKTATARMVSATARVLVVEDEGVIALEIASILQTNGYEVVGIEKSGEKALERALAERPDVVLMDIRLRGEWDGIEAARRIRDQLDIPIVYLTAHADRETLKRAKTTEPFGYIVKPFNAADVRATLEMSLHQHRMQRALKDREGSLSAVMGGLTEAIFVCNAQGDVKIANAAAEALVGLHGPDVSGKRLTELFSYRSESSAVESEIDESARMTTGILTRRDGKQRLVVVSLVTLCNQETSAPETLLLFRDISDVQSAESVRQTSNAELTKSNEPLTQLTSSLIHDLQEPLRTIKFAAQLLERGRENNVGGESTDYLTWIRESSVRMQGMIGSLLDYYHSASLADASAALVKSGDSLESALSNLRAATLASGAVITFADLPEVHVHPVALGRVFQNLIGNAIKFRRAAPLHIHVSAQRDGEFWTFTVEDNGTGFDASRHDIFSLFKRAHGPEIAGHGVGLATCRKLVEQFGGRIWVESIVGEGSKFHFTLPAGDVDVQPPSLSVNASDR